jgi:ketosteroid isomerase-like protein
MKMGDRGRVHADVRAENGSVIAAPKVTWKSSDPSVLQIDATRGTVRALRAGSAEITAKAGRVEAQLSMQVSAPRLLALVVQDARSLTVGESFTLHLTAQSDAGVVDATTLGTMGITPRWSSSAPNVARIDARTGELTAVARGSTTITVEAGALKGSASLAVTAPLSGPGPVVPTQTQPNPPIERVPRVPDRHVRTESDVRREVGDALNAYAAAIKAQDLDAMQRVYSEMQEKDRATWRGFFAAASDFAYTVDRLDFDAPIDVSDSGQVQLTRYFTLSYTTKKDNRAQRSSGKDRVTLVRKHDGWHITQVR